VGGVIALTLTACTTDSVFEDMDQQTLTNANNGLQNQTNTYTGSGKYNSPWDFNKRKPVAYIYECNLQPYYGIVVRITPYIGLAYYDGADDGVYNTPTGSHNLITGNYPNLYSGGSEYGSYVQANPIVLGKNIVPSTPSLTWVTHELAIFSPEDHCPIRNVNIGYNYNLQSVKFDIMNNNLVQPVTHLGYPLTTPPPAGTNAETQLLAQYGKVFYYKIEFGSDFYNFTETYYAFGLDAFPIDDSTEWTNLGLTDSFNGALYYHSNGTNGNPTTYEIVVDAADFVYDPTFMLSGTPRITTSYGTRVIELIGNNAGGWVGSVGPNPGINAHMIIK